MHTSAEDSDGLGEDYYVISRGDFSGSPKLEAIGGERWTAIEDPPPPPLDSPMAASSSASPVTPTQSGESSHAGGGRASKGNQTKPKPLRKMSVTQLVSKLDSESPKSPDKRLPTLSPEERAQMASLTRHMHEMRREEDEEIEIRTRRKIDWIPAQPSRKTAVDGFQFPEDPNAPQSTIPASSSAGPVSDRPNGLMPGAFFPFAEDPPSTVLKFQADHWNTSEAGPALESGSVSKSFHFGGEGSSGLPLSFRRNDEGMSEWFRNHQERHAKAHWQVEDFKKRMLEEEYARGGPVNVSAVTSYKIDKDGNVSDIKAMSGGRQLVLGDQCVHNGSYRVIGEVTSENGNEGRSPEYEHEPNAVVLDPSASDPSSEGRHGTSFTEP